ncbi:hypothetical protein, partial [Microcystis sp. T1-4]|uniref:hypothetical protein n=1 Tax=Microcystis sp. T1-4 TaxID=1160279 RepID=UPI001E5ECE3F
DRNHRNVQSNLYSSSVCVRPWTGYKGRFLSIVFDNVFKTRHPIPRPQKKLFQQTLVILPIGRVGR